MLKDREAAIGRSLQDLSTPAVIIDRAVVRRNCEQMLTMTDNIGVAFRAHIKTHKTVEGTELMAGGPNSTRPISLIVSTTLEFEHIAAWLKTQKSAGRPINVLYGIPLPVHKIDTLISLSEQLGPGSVSVMIDHPAQIDALQKHPSLKPKAFIKIDTGYGRAGVPHSPESASLRGLLKRMQQAQEGGYVDFLGLYSHGGDAYGASSFKEAFVVLERELKGLEEAARIAKEEGVQPGKGEKGFVLSLGATPQISTAWMNADSQVQNGEVPAMIKKLHGDGHTVEFHAGNYPILDMQQIATSAGATSMIDMPSASYYQGRQVSDLSFTILAEINSSYSERADDERLITAGCLALGREPCKSYPGWGVVSAWPHGSTGTKGGILRGSGWYVHSISQEHGRIKKGSVPGVPAPREKGEGGVVEDAPEGGREPEQPIDWAVGDKVRIWPNHACIACANYPHFYVVDGEDESKGDKVVDVWERCVGW